MWSPLCLKQSGDSQTTALKQVLFVTLFHVCSEVPEPEKMAPTEKEPTPLKREEVAPKGTFFFRLNVLSFVFICVYMFCSLCRLLTWPYFSTVEKKASPEPKKISPAGTFTFLVLSELFMSVSNATVVRHCLST